MSVALPCGHRDFGSSWEGGRPFQCVHEWRGMKMTGVKLIAVERDRQVHEEGYDAEHDRGLGEDLAEAAIAYAIASTDPRGHASLEDARLEWWPFHIEAWKPTGDRVRDLIKAGALIAAALDALQEA